MDSARFGRVLGTGARLAGKTLLAAVDAATAPNPRAAGAAPAGQTKPTQARPRPAGEVLGPIREEVPRADEQVRAAQTMLKRGGRQLGAAAWRPFAKATGVLWLEVSGVFFALIALLGVQGVWARRAVLWGGWHGAGHRQLLISAALAIIFGYFSVSNFVRASRRGRRP